MPICDLRFTKWKVGYPPLWSGDSFGVGELMRWLWANVAPRRTRFLRIPGLESPGYRHVIAPRWVGMPDRCPARLGNLAAEEAEFGCNGSSAQRVGQGWSRLVKADQGGLRLAGGQDATGEENAIDCPMPDGRSDAGQAVRCQTGGPMPNRRSDTGRRSELRGNQSRSRLGLKGAQAGQINRDSAKRTPFDHIRFHRGNPSKSNQIQPKKLCPARPVQEGHGIRRNRDN